VAGALASAAVAVAAGAVAGAPEGSPTPVESIVAKLQLTNNPLIRNKLNNSNRR
jgi:hypothetical protein